MTDTQQVPDMLYFFNRKYILYICQFRLIFVLVPTVLKIILIIFNTNCNINWSIFLVSKTFNWYLNHNDPLFIILTFMYFSVNGSINIAMAKEETSILHKISSLLSWIETLQKPVYIIYNVQHNQLPELAITAYIIPLTNWNRNLSWIFLFLFHIKKRTHSVLSHLFLRQPMGLWMCVWHGKYSEEPCYICCSHFCSYDWFLISLSNSNHFISLLLMLYLNVAGNTDLKSPTWICALASSHYRQ